MSETCKYCDMPANESCSPAQRSTCGHFLRSKNPNFGKLPAPDPEPEPDPSEDQHYDPLDALLEDDAPQRPNPKKAFGDKKLGSAHVPPFAVQLMALAMYQSAGKYGAFNWRDDPPDATTFLNAIQRHIDLYASGQNEAVDGTHHLAHVMASCAILIDAEFVGTLIDDRHKTDPLTQFEMDRYILEQKKHIDGTIEDHRRWHGAPED